MLTFIVFYRYSFFWNSKHTLISAGYAGQKIFMANAFFRQLLLNITDNYSRGEKEHFMAKNIFLILLFFTCLVTAGCSDSSGSSLVRSGFEGGGDSNTTGNNENPNNNPNDNLNDDVTEDDNNTEGGGESQNSGGGFYFVPGTNIPGNIPKPETPKIPPPPSGGEEEPVEEESDGEFLGTFKWTHYWIVFEDDFPGAKNTKLVHWKDCSVIAWVSKNYYDQIKVEGTGFLSDGRLINKYGNCPSACNMSGYKCFNEVDKQEAPFGHGSQDNPLRPYISVASDVNVVPFGTVLYVPALDGVEMPDEHNMIDYAPFVHDGCVVAEDEGSSIDGYHLDFFSATHADYLIIDEAMNDIGKVDVYINSPKCE